MAEQDEVRRPIQIPQMPPSPKKVAHRKMNKVIHNVEVEKQENLDIFYLMLTLRFVNALLVQTFFQPDEYFQSLEPAWRIAFGGDSGAWITWEWQHQLRTSMHPVLFAGIYYVSDTVMKGLSMYPQFRAMILVYLPKVFQGIIAAYGDYYTWKLADKVYERGSNYAWTALTVSIFSPWQWFCSTRTLSNSLETVLTVAALCRWPWHLYGDAEASVPIKADSKKWKFLGTSEIFRYQKDINELRICLFLAAIACLLRPTNLLIWLSMVTVAFAHLGVGGKSKSTLKDFIMVAREAVMCGVGAFAASAISDRLYFGFWTFPPYQWLHFNISQDLAVFYGQNRWDYYVTEGLPLLLTTYLPFAVIGLVTATGLSGRFDTRTANIRFQLAFTVLVMIATLSLISHKEVRFIYPLLPVLHVLLAPHISSFFELGSNPAHAVGGLSKPAKHTICIPYSWRRALLILLATTNVGICLYTSLVHQRGVISVMSYLREDYERLHLSMKGEALTEDNETFAAFLMPCHSTPWRSHLVYSNLHAWALTCEPPLDVPAGTPERANYRDEADRFFDDPVGFLKREVGNKHRPWPRYIVAFEGVTDLENVLREYIEDIMGGWTLKRNNEFFNSHWHDDSRRRGKVLVWEMAQAAEVGIKFIAKEAETLMPDTRSNNLLHPRTDLKYDDRDYSLEEEL